MREIRLGTETGTPQPRRRKHHSSLNRPIVSNASVPAEAARLHQAPHQQSETYRAQAFNLIVSNGPGFMRKPTSSFTLLIRDSSSSGSDTDDLDSADLQ